MPPELPRDPFVAAIEAKIAAWTAVLDSYRAAVSMDGPLTDVTGGAKLSTRQIENGTPPMDLPVGVFRDKSIREAIEIFLGAGRRKQTNKEIAAGLQKGGIATTSANFEATIATALGRMKEDGVVLRFPDGWDLAASYPDSLRTRLEKEAKPRRVAKRAKPAEPKKPRTPKNDDNKTQQMAEVIGAAPPLDGFSTGEVVEMMEALNQPVTPDYVRVVTKRLRKRGLIEIRNGRYYPPASTESSA